MKFKNLLPLITLCTLPSLAHAQSQTGKGDIDADYEGIVRKFESFLPDCSISSTVNPVSEDPLTWINKISFVLRASLRDAERDFNDKPFVAYLQLKGALDAVSEKAKDCKDLRSVLSRPVARDTLKAIQILEDKTSAADELSRGRILYDFARASVLVADNAATTMDRDYFAPYRNCWNPRTGFYADSESTYWNAPLIAEDLFAEKLLRLAGQELSIFDSLGEESVNGVFVHKLGLRLAILPVAMQLVTSVQNALKTNLAIFSRQSAYIQLQLLNSTISGYMSSDPGRSVPVMFQDIHNQIRDITVQLNWSNNPHFQIYK